jgi:hypothetical protein
VARVEATADDNAEPTSATDSLSFLDLIYAVPVADLAVRLSSAQLDKVTAADWSTVGVEIAVLLFSWVGLHQNRTEMANRTVLRWWIGNMKFWSARFIQFCVEVGITALYFVVGLTLDLPQRSGQAGSLPSEKWVLSTLLAVWIAYLLWDGLDVFVGRHHSDGHWARRAALGGAVTLGFTVLLVVMLAVEAANPARRDHSILAWNLGLLVFLYIYRVSQQFAKKKWAQGLVPAGPTIRWQR